MEKFRLNFLAEQYQCHLRTYSGASELSVKRKRLGFSGVSVLNLYQNARRDFVKSFNLLKLTGSVMDHQLTFNSCTLCPQFKRFCIYLRTNSDLCHLEHKLIGFYNRDEMCLQGGMDWIFK